MHMKATIKYHYTPSELLKFRKLKRPAISRMGKDVKQLEFSYTAEGNIK